MSKVVEAQEEETEMQKYFHSLHQCPEVRMRVGETRNATGGRVWADTGKPSVGIKPGCPGCKRAYPEGAK